MYRFKRSLIALMGVLTLVVIVTVALPHIGRGASGNSAPTSQTQNVKVVNTPGEAVPVQGTVAPVTGSSWNVSVNNFPATTNIGIDGSANTVKIDTTNPVSVRDVDNPAKQPFNAFNSLVLPFGQTQGSVQITNVPAGKVLVIEDVSALALFSGDDKLMYGSIAIGGNQHYLQVNDQGIDQLGRRVYVASQHLRLYLDEGTVVQFFAERNPATGQSGINVSVFGYFVDKP